MRDLKLIISTLGQINIDDIGADGLSGAYRTNGKDFRYVCSWGGGWEHVSVSLPNEKRCPTWEEMCMFKNIFWEAEEFVLQIHPPKSQYVNRVKNCLHLWKPLEQELELPLMSLVG